MFKKIISDFKIPVRFHIIFWTVYFVFNIIRFGSLNNDYWYSLKSNLVEFPLSMLYTYFFVYYLIPRYILKKKYTQFIVLFIFSLILFYLVKTGLIYLLVTKNIWPENSGFNAFTFDHIVEVTIGVLYVTAVGATIKLTYEWINEKRRNEELEKTQLRTELNFLKSQIQPHFFFNTLNNLYALVIKKSPNAPDVVLKLSEIMQYVLYEAKEPKITLLREVNYIYSYLDLEKLRYGDKIRSDIEIVGDIDEIEIPPLLFLPFIENCFKHGIANNDDIKVNICFKIKDNHLLFNVTNTFDPSNNKNLKHGIGIENVRRRLQLLYGNNFTLETKIEKSKFKVRLQFPIDYQEVEKL